MPKTLLSVNAGSSSVKITFYRFERPPKAIADAQVTGITSSPQTFKYKRGSRETKEQIDESINSPQDAFKFLLERCFSDSELSEAASTEDIAYVCHRVVHGGDYNDAVEINDETYHHLIKIENLAPLYALGLHDGQFVNLKLLS
jgi:acetate kinase